MRLVPIVAACIGIGAPAALAQWAVFENEGAARMIAAPGLGLSDPEEKAYAWGDVDHDGDIDLVVARRGPFTPGGPKRNVLFINEGVADGHSFNGVLVDRTDDLAVASDVGGSGFLDLTNDRDIILIDVNNDTWLDAVTGVTYGTGPKWMTHHRVYLNLGVQAGEWQGFRYEEGRIPQLVQAPNACAAAGGDVTGDGFADLYFTTYNSSVLEDHLLINDGTGHFTDQTSTRMTSGMIQSSFGTGGQIVDFNQDGWKDVLKSENGPVKILYNAGSGFFNQFETASSGAHYDVSSHDLNNDGLPDLVISDDGTDRYRLNEGVGGDGFANFANQTFFGASDGFGGDSAAGDLNKDGFNDVLISDCDVDVSGCDRRLHVFRNLANVPLVTMQETVTNGKVVNIPTSQMTGSHDVAVFDINGDTWPDIVIGRCAGHAVWVNQPPIGILFTYPGGLPTLVPPDTGADLVVHLEPIGGADIMAGSVKVFASVNGGPFVEQSASSVGNGDYQAPLPGAACGSPIDFYVMAQLESGETFTDPSNAPNSAYGAMAALGTDIALLDQIEEDVSAWTTENAGAPSDIGQWEQSDPIPTLFNSALAAPDDDATPGHEKFKAFVTENGETGGGAGATDVDGGPFHLISPLIDLSGADATISYARWFFSDGIPGTHVPDALSVSVSADDGLTWVPVPEHTTGGTGSAWEIVAFDVSDYVEPTGQVRVRFSTSDLPNNSVTEAAIDDFKVARIDCGTVPCPSDLNQDGAVSVEDMVTVVLDWGCTDPPGPCTGDVNQDGTVDVQDMVEVVLAWGACP
jgi:hypothetical protein